MVDVICRLLGPIGVALMVFMFPVAALLPVMYGIYFFVVRRKDGWRKNPFVWLDLLTPVIASIVWVVMVSTITTHKSLSNFFRAVCGWRCVQSAVGYAVLAVLAHFQRQAKSSIEYALDNMCSNRYCSAFDAMPA